MSLPPPPPPPPEPDGSPTLPDPADATAPDASTPDVPASAAPATAAPTGSPATTSGPGITPDTIPTRDEHGLTTGLPALASRVTLSTRMVVLLVVTLTVGLAISTVAATAQLRSHMLAQVDEQLTVALRSSEGMPLNDLVRSINRTALESDLQLSLQIDGRQVSPQELHEPRWGTPDVPLFSATSKQLDGLPFTLEGDSSPAGVGTQWRAVARPVVGAGDRFIGAIVVALPVAPVTQTTSELGKVLALVSVVLVAAAASLGYLAVRRSLRPLRQIEATARRIADGDMSSRIPDMPSTTEVGSVAQSLNVMLGRIQESFDARAASEARMRRFVADASHELRTPLVSIRGYAELYRMGAVTTPEQTSETMGRIESSAVQMGTLVEDLLALARLDEQRPLALQQVDLVEVAADALADLGAMDPTRTTSLVLTGPDGEEPVPDDGSPLLVVADDARLRQVFTNLVGNVQRHTPAGSPVEIVLSSDGQVARAAVRDHGPGIPAEHREAVFERFHRVDASRNSSSGGSGLGLAIVRSILRAHRGDIIATETPGGGATFVVTVPLAT
ncbi:cell wall metabolism sensor histidine kinase WalK [Sanguibacter sp. HDW7]|uniref:sensor histidine kinase n=1 Tax=Sanguibacter sp. HDW7 TaxID=2714931 RepID=UPI00140DE962|nr:HAMP domain-containing sensor histidine kinase [Sanguibacter sp. HDW7]QIK84334.1 HAMP domain-containing histidine kinase [Sanguibacter sp. HDW7]